MENMPHRDCWKQPRAKSLSVQKPEGSCSGCSKVLLQEMFPHQQVRPMTSWLDLLQPRLPLPQPWSCVPGCKRGRSRPWDRALPARRWQIDLCRPSAVCLQAACRVAMQRESRWGREHTLVMAAPGAALSPGHWHWLPAEHLLFPGSLSLERHARVSHRSRDPGQSKSGEGPMLPLSLQLAPSLSGWKEVQDHAVSHSWQDFCSAPGQPHRGGPGNVFTFAA